MRIIGITGGIGTGKSTLLSWLKQEKGVYVLEADSLAHRLMEPGRPAYLRIVEAFGADILGGDGRIDRERLGPIVFRENAALKTLNGIVHPAVKQYILADIEEKRAEGETAFYVIEAALLIEDGYREVCDELWYVYVEREERIRRLMEGRGGKREKYERVIASQQLDAYYKEHCDITIDNGEDLEKTINIVKGLLYKSR